MAAALFLRLGLAHGFSLWTLVLRRCNRFAPLPKITGATNHVAGATKGVACLSGFKGDGKPGLPHHPKRAESVYNATTP